MSSPQMVPTISAKGEFVESDTDEMRGTRRGLEDNDGRSDIDRADPVAQHRCEPRRRGPIGRKLVGERVADPSVAADLERSELLQVSRHGRLGDFEAEARETRGDLILTREGVGADQVRNRALSSFLKFAHALLYALTCIFMQMRE